MADDGLSLGERVTGCACGAYLRCPPNGTLSLSGLVQGFAATAGWSRIATRFIWASFFSNEDSHHGDAALLERSQPLISMGENPHSHGIVVDYRIVYYECLLDPKDSGSEYNS